MHSPFIRMKPPCYDRLTAAAVLLHHMKPESVKIFLLFISSEVSYIGLLRRCSQPLADQIGGAHLKVSSLKGQLFASIRRSSPQGKRSSTNSVRHAPDALVAGLATHVVCQAQCSACSNHLVDNIFKYQFILALFHRGSRGWPEPACTRLRRAATHS